MEPGESPLNLLRGYFAGFDTVSNTQNEVVRCFIK